MGINFVPNRVIAIQDAIEEYMLVKSSTGTLSETSIYNRNYELNRFARFCNSHNVVNVIDIHKNLIIAYLREFKILNSTKTTILFILAAFMDYLVEEELILENMAAIIQKPKIYQPEADYLTYDELERLFQTEARKAPPKSVDRNLLLLSLFSILCLRASEVINMKFEDVRLDIKEVWVERKGGKIAKIPLNDDLVDRFLNWYAVRDQYKGHELPYVFLSSHGNQLTPRQARYIVSKALNRAKIIKRKKGTHLLRHSGASLLSEAGEDPRKIQFLLGHTSLATTNRYLHFDREALKEMIDRSPSILGVEGLRD
jgi:integrase/recombinase XerD